MARLLGSVRGRWDSFSKHNWYYRIIEWVQTRYLLGCDVFFLPNSPKALKENRGWEVICLSLFVSGPARLRQPHPAGCGALDGHDDSPRESGDRLVQTEPLLNPRLQVLISNSMQTSWSSGPTGPSKVLYTHWVQFFCTRLETTQRALDKPGENPWHGLIIV